jgi:hypothetical protein
VVLSARMTDPDVKDPFLKSIQLITTFIMISGVAILSLYKCVVFCMCDFNALTHTHTYTHTHTHVGRWLYPLPTSHIIGTATLPCIP